LQLFNQSYRKPLGSILDLFKDGFMKFLSIPLVWFLMFQAPSFAEELEPIENAVDGAALEEILNEEWNEIAPASVPDSEPKTSLKIEEIEKYLSTVDPGQTCLDEYVKRRKQMVIKLSLTPVTLPLTVGASAVGFGFIGNRLGTLNNPPGGWGDLAGTVAGMVYGGGGMLIYASVDAIRTAVKLHRLNLILKTLGEHHLGRPGKKTDELYAFYLKKNAGREISKAELIARLLESDRNGTLCDGSMLKKKRIRIGPDLKFKVANARDFVKYLNRP
jgi:hypothetical protein